MRTDLNTIQKRLAIQRLTALWAFAESGLGGMLHAFRIPVTGLVLGSISVICISMIASFSGKQTINILKSLLVVLIIKAVVSPQTPFPAYIAVGFQGLIGFIFYSVARMNFVSILFVAVLSMMESAFQKLLMVAMFFGGSLWVALDEMVQFIGKPLGLETSSASMLIIGCYLFIYMAGGILTAIVAYKLVKQSFSLNEQVICETISPQEGVSKKKTGMKWIVIITGLLLLVFTGLYKGNGAGVIRPLAWTITVILGWYFIIVPWITGMLQKILMRSGNKYQAEAMEIISFFPFIRRIATHSWKATENKSVLSRLPAFVVLLITTLLSFQSQQLQDQK